jgi:hypothetical protein
MQAYGPLREVYENVFCRDGEWYGSKFRRRMTVIRLPDGKLWVHNPFALDDEDVRGLMQLGEVAHVVAPSTFHCSELEDFLSEFPQAMGFAPDSILKKMKKGFSIVPTETGYPAELNSAVTRIALDGTRMDESAFFHPKSRTLVVADLIFNLRAEISFHPRPRGAPLFDPQYTEARHRKRHHEPRRNPDRRGRPTPARIILRSFRLGSGVYGVR